VGLFTIVPWYVRWGVLAAALVATFCGGAVEGIKYQQGVQAVAEAKAVKKTDETRKQVAVGTQKIQKDAVVRKTQRDAVQEKANAETVEHAKLPDPPECALAPERVRSINDAWLGTAADSGADTGRVRNPAAAEVGRASGSGAVGEGTSAGVPGVRGSAAGAVGDRAASSTSGGTR
jgi:hypothetical protein